MASGVLSTLINEKSDKTLRPVYTVEKDEDENVRVTETPGDHSLIRDVAHAIHTIDNDPQGHKKKALLGLAGAGAGLGATAWSMSNPRFQRVLKRKGLRSTFDNGIRSIIESKPSTPKRLLTALAVAATPAAAYYALQNLDRPKRAVPAATYAVASNTVRAANLPYVHVPSSLMPNAVAYAAGPMAMAGGFNYAAEQFQRQDEHERKEAIKSDPKLTETQRESAIEDINAKRDLYSRYPAFRYAPYGSSLRSYYNNAHGYATPASDFIRTKVRE